MHVLTRSEETVVFLCQILVKRFRGSYIRYQLTEETFTSAVSMYRILELLTVVFFLSYSRKTELPSEASLFSVSGIPTSKHVRVP